MQQCVTGRSCLSEFIEQEMRRRKRIVKLAIIVVGSIGMLADELLNHHESKNKRFKEEGGE